MQRMVERFRGYILAEVDMEYRRRQLLSKYQGSSNIGKLNQHQVLSLKCVRRIQMGLGNHWTLNSLKVDAIPKKS